MIWSEAVALVNVRVVAGAAVRDSIRFSSRVLSLGDPPRKGDVVVDLGGAFVLPGLVNAHDHLELNHYGRITGRERYENASEWIDDMRPRLTGDPAIAAAKRHPLTERLFAGALKNLLAGVTTVAHHNPYYAELRRTIPIRVVRRYGWAHSFALEGQPAGARGEPGGGVAERWRATRTDTPFIVHLGEGTDARAAAELPRLEALGALAANTVLVHGVAIDEDGWRRAAQAGAGLVWCPASNQFLLGRTIDPGALRHVRVALGTDSRLTGARDLLDELAAAHATGLASDAELLAMVTTAAADLLRLPRAGRLEVGAPADLMVIPEVRLKSDATIEGDVRGGGAASSTRQDVASDFSRTSAAAAALVQTKRRDVGLVVVGGRPLIADPRHAAIFAARHVGTRRICVDGADRLADSALVRRIAGCPIAEPGVTIA